jgi:hypothetical protein
MDLGHWFLLENVIITEETFGFIYEITNNINNKKYIGNKQCQSKIKRKPLKGKTRNRIDFKESDWKSYTSSSNVLNEDILKHGKENFTFKILKPLALLLVLRTSNKVGVGDVIGLPLRVKALATKLIGRFTGPRRLTQVISP